MTHGQPDRCKHSRHALKPVHPSTVFWATGNPSRFVGSFAYTSDTNTRENVSGRWKRSSARRISSNLALAASLSAQMGVRILRCETVCSGPDSHRANLVLSQPDGGRSERCSIMAPASNLGLAGDLRTDEIVGNWRSQRKPWDGNRTREDTSSCRRCPLSERSSLCICRRVW